MSFILKGVFLTSVSSLGIRSMIFLYNCSSFDFGGDSCTDLMSLPSETRNTLMQEATDAYNKEESCENSGGCRTSRPPSTVEVEAVIKTRSKVFEQGWLETLFEKLVSVIRSMYPGQASVSFSKDNSLLLLGFYTIGLFKPRTSQ